MVALPCGSRSTSSTRRSACARAAAKLTLVVVLPTPPFWFTTASTRATSAPCRTKHEMALRVEQRHLQRDDPAVTSLRRGTCHCCQHAAGGHEVRAARPELIEPGERARDDELEFRLRPPLFDASRMHGHVRQLELDRRLAQESELFLARVVQRDTPLWPCERNRDARQASASAHVGESAFGGNWEVGYHGQRVEQMVAHDFSGFANRREVVGAVPLFQQFHVSHEQSLGPLRELKPELGYAPVKRVPRCHAVLCSTVLKPRLRCTSSREIAAGVTPEMRAAWPTVRGRWRSSFCWTSTESPFTWR